MERFVWTHPTPEPKTGTPVAGAQVAAYGPAAGYVSYPPGTVHPPVPAELAAYSATVRGRTPHGLHLILTICTVGFWAPVWAAHVLWNHATRKRITVPVRGR